MYYVYLLQSINSPELYIHAADLEPVKGTMKNHLTLLSILTFSFLSGCIPYVGRDYHDEDLCLGMDIAMVSYGSGDCRHMSQRRKKDSPKDAPDSSKHIIYSEEQRLAIAKEAAHRLYPNAKFFMATWPAVKAIWQAGGDAMRSCNGMLAKRALAARLSSQFSDEPLFDSIAHNWSQRYSDSQLTQIQQASYVTDLTGLDKTKAASVTLSPQRSIGGSNPMTETKDDSIRKQIDAYWIEHQATLKTMAKEELTRAEESRQFAPTDLCRIGGGSDPATGDYVFVIDHWAMEHRNKAK